MDVDIKILDESANKIKKEINLQEIKSEDSFFTIPHTQSPESDKPKLLFSLNFLF